MAGTQYLRTCSVCHRVCLNRSDVSLSKVHCTVCHRRIINKTNHEIAFCPRCPRTGASRIWLASHMVAITFFISAIEQSASISSRVTPRPAVPRRFPRVLTTASSLTCQVAFIFSDLLRNNSGHGSCDLLSLVDRRGECDERHRMAGRCCI
jgi:ribosomal protein L37AE/L43A